MSNLAYIDFPDDDAVAEYNSLHLKPLNTPAQLAPQGTDEWHQDKCGCISASGVADMMAGGGGVTRKKYLTELAVERLTGQPLQDGFKSPKMQNGIDREQEARDAYALIYDHDIIQTGFIRHPAIDNFGASPDGLVGKDGMVEIKRRDLHIHLDLLKTKKPPRTAFLQIQTQFSCTGRQWCDYASYNETLPPRLRLIVVRVWRDDAAIAELEAEAIKFNKEINALVKELKEL